MQLLLVGKQPGEMIYIYSIPDWNITISKYTSKIKLTTPNTATKKAKTTEPVTTTATATTPCLVDADGKIPVNTVSRIVRVKVTGEDKAIKVQEALKKVDDTLKQHKGFMKSTRFVCKEHWDMMLVLQFENVDSLKAFMVSELKTEAEKLVTDVAKDLVEEKIHWQNFVTDTW